MARYSNKEPGRVIDLPRYSFSITLIDIRYFVATRGALRLFSCGMTSRTHVSFRLTWSFYLENVTGKFCYLVNYQTQGTYIFVL